MNSTKQIAIGFFFGVILPVLGANLYLILFTKWNLFNHFFIIKSGGILGKVLTLGAMLNVAVFLLFFYLKKDAIAKGILMALIVLTILTLFL
jgi:hypothetical protein